MLIVALGVVRRSPRTLANMTKEDRTTKLAYTTLTVIKGFTIQCQMLTDTKTSKTDSFNDELILNNFLIVLLSWIKCLVPEQPNNIVFLSRIIT